MNAYVLKAVTDGELQSVLDLYKACEDFLGLGPQPCASMEMMMKTSTVQGERGASSVVSMTLKAIW